MTVTRADRGFLMLKEAGTGAVEATAPSTGVRIEIERSLVFEGKVVGGGPRFTILFRAPTTGWSTSLDGTGRFSAKLTDDTEGFVYVRSPDDDRYALVEGVRPSRSPHTFHLVSGESIDGRVEGEPSASRTVVAEGLRSLLAEAPVQPDGTFRIRGLPPGRYRLYLQSGPVEAVVEASPGARGVVLRAKAAAPAPSSK